MDLNQLLEIFHVSNHFLPPQQRNNTFPSKGSRGVTLWFFILFYISFKEHGLSRAFLNQQSYYIANIRIIIDNSKAFLIYFAFILRINIIKHRIAWCWLDFLYIRTEVTICHVLQCVTFPPSISRLCVTNRKKYAYATSKDTK